MKVRRFRVIARGRKKDRAGYPKHVTTPHSIKSLPDVIWKLFDGSDNALERLHEKGSRAGNVDSLKSISFGSEKAAFIQKDTGLVQEEVSKLMLVQAKGATVEPDKIGPLGLNDFDFRELSLKEGDHRLETLFQIVQEIFKPGFSLLVCGTTRCCAERVDSEQTVGKKTFFELLTDMFVRNDDVGGMKACQIERFTRCRADNTVFLKGTVCHGKRAKHHTWINQVSMNLVCNDLHMVAPTDATEALEFFACPDTADRIVRAA